MCKKNILLLNLGEIFNLNDSINTNMLLENNEGKCNTTKYGRYSSSQFDLYIKNVTD